MTNCRLYCTLSFLRRDPDCYINHDLCISADDAKKGIRLYNLQTLFSYQ